MKKLISLLLVAVLLLGLGMIGAQADEEITLKVLITSSYFDIDNDVTADLCRRLSGYNIEFEVINNTEQLMLIISSGQAYDYVTLSKTNYDLMMANGALVDISGLLTEYGPNITEGYSTLWPSVSVDGGIYAIPSAVPQPNSLNRAIIARKDLLEKIGYTEENYPLTVDAFVKMLEELKAAYPDMVPLTAPSGWLITNIASAYNVLGEQASYQVVDGHVISSIDSPNIEAYLTIMRDLYARGLLDQEMPALNAKTAQSKWAASNAVMEYVSWNGSESYIATLRELNPEAEFVVLPLLQDENGQVHSQVKSGVSAYGGFPVTGEHTEEAIKAINNMMQSDNYKELVIGVEGVHWEEVEGEIVPIQPAFTDEKNNSNSFVGGFYREDVYPTYWELRLKKSPDLQRCFYEMRSRLLDGGVDSPIALAPTVTVIDNLDSLHSKISSTLISIIAGTSDMSELEALRTYWSKNGGDQVIAFYDAWYNENIAQ